jgi:uncharacterized protein (TIGR04141 family)
MATRRLTFYLVRDGITDFDEVLTVEKPADAVPLAESSGVDGRFYRTRPQPKRPAWVSYLQPLLAEDVGDMRSSSASGLLLIRSSGRIFALTFGYGRSMLDLSKIVYQFGLRVTLNRIDPQQIRSLDTKTFEEMVVSTNTQASRSAELPTFGIDVSTDILRAATGEPRDKAFAKRLSGADALVMNVERDPSDLPTLCDELLAAFHDDDYKADFGWIDQLALVRDSDLLDTLHERLVSDLTAGSTAATHLALPEPIGWEDIDAFKIGGTRNHEYDDLDIDAYLNELGNRRREITLNRLKTRRVSVRFARTDKFDDRWTLYHCLVSEHRLDGTLYVLIEGRWFTINDSLVSEVDSFVSGLSSPRVTLIPASPGEPERDYNDRLASSSDGALLKLDAKVRRPGGAASGIELCDVLTDQGEFVHVKRKSRSATLSHLFAQGSVSAETFLSDGHFRDEIRRVINNEVAKSNRKVWLDLIPSGSDPVDRGRNYCVTFAVVTDSSRAGMDWLPFFSRLNLMHHARQLRNLGFDVAVTRVPLSLT